MRSEKIVVLHVAWPKHGRARVHNKDAAYDQIVGLTAAACSSRSFAAVERSILALALPV